MKRCPQCHREYFDDTLNFCLEDGERLLNVPAGSEATTAILEPGKVPAEAPARQAAEETVVLPGGAVDKKGGLGIPIDRKMLLAGGIVLFLVGAGVFGYKYFGLSTRVQINSIAVLPFENESGNSDIEYLSDGMTESMINSLSRLPNLSVKARSSVFRYKGKGAEPTAVGKDLDVQAVLNGRVVQRGDDVTISLELVNVATGDHIWGGQYNRKFGDLAVLQNEITRDVSQNLRLQLTGSQGQVVNRNPTQNSEAYQLYLQGRYHWNKRTIDSNRRAIEYFQRALEKDPSYALAYVGLAECYVTGFLSHRERKPKVEAAAQKALEIDPALGEPHAVLGMMRTSDFQYAEADNEFLRAIDLSPNYATAYHWYAESLAMQGRFDESFAQYKKALELDPLSLPIGTDLGRTYYLARQYDKAIEHLENLIEMDKNYARTHFYLSTAYQEKGLFERSVEAVGAGLILNGEEPGKVELAKRVVLEQYKASGPRGYWKAVLQVQKDDLRNRAYINPVTIAAAHARLGERDEAFAWLEKMFEEGGGAYAALKVSPEWDNLRDDPRFRDVLRRAGVNE